MRLDNVQKGYMTVEAAFIIPWVMFIVVWIMYLAYFEYDRALLFQDNYRIACQVSSYIATNEGKKNRLDELLGKNNSSKYMGTRDVHMEGEVTARNIKLESGLKVSHPLSFSAELIPTSNWNISDKVEIDNYSFTKRLRTFRSVGRIFEE